MPQYPMLFAKRVDPPPAPHAGLKGWSQVRFVRRGAARSDIKNNNNNPFSTKLGKRARKINEQHNIHRGTKAENRAIHCSYFSVLLLVLLKDRTKQGYGGDRELYEAAVSSGASERVDSSLRHYAALSFLQHRSLYLDSVCTSKRTRYIKL